MLVPSSPSITSYELVYDRPDQTRQHARLVLVGAHDHRECSGSEQDLPSRDWNELRVGRAGAVRKEGDGQLRVSYIISCPQGQDDVT